MINKLEPILLQKQREVAALQQCVKNNRQHPITQIMHGIKQPHCIPSFKNALKTEHIAIIAEIKRKSPSKGTIAAIKDPVELAQRYIAGGANALSILTDQHYFNGHINDLIQVKNSASTFNTPLLRKDFIIDPLQIAEAAAVGSSAVLCIVAVLGNKIKSFIEFAHTLNIDVLVEVHDYTELQIALDCGADVIGINNRNLKTFVVDTDHALNIVSHIPSSIIKVAESGIHDPSLVKQYYHAGFDAVLIGEALVTSKNPKQFMLECRHES